MASDIERSVSIARQLDDLFGEEGRCHRPPSQGRGSNTIALAQLSRDIVEYWDSLYEPLQNRIKEIFITRFEGEKLVQVSLF